MSASCHPSGAFVLQLGVQLAHKLGCDNLKKLAASLRLILSYAESARWMQINFKMDQPQDVMHIKKRKNRQVRQVCQGVLQREQGPTCRVDRFKLEPVPAAMHGS